MDDMEELAAFKYCPRCRGDMGKDEGAIKCVNCGLKYFGSPRPSAAAVLVNDKQEYLVVKKKAEPVRGRWDFPGGFVDRGESLEQAVTREIKEELDLVINDWEHLGSYADKYEYQSVIYPTLITIFKGKVGSNVQIKLNEELAEYGFYSIQKISELNSAYSYFQEVVKTLKASNKNILP